MPGWVGPVISGLSLLVGLIGLVAYVKSRRVRRPLFLTSFYPVVPDVPLRDLEVRYRGQDVPRLTGELVYFWNAGTTTVRADDVAPGDPLRIEVPSDVDLLHAVVIARTREANRSSVDDQHDPPTTVPVTFDFLDPNDGLTVHLLHTGEASRAAVKGTVMNAPNNGQPDRVWHATPSDMVRRSFFLTLGMAVIEVLIATGLLMWLLPALSIPTLPTIPIAALLMVLATFLGANKERGRRRYVIPSELLP